MGDAWEDEGYGGEDEWGVESVEADLEEDQLELEPEEVGAGSDDELDDDFDDAA